LQLDFICRFQIWTHKISIMLQYWTECNEQFTYRLTSPALSARRSSSRMLLRAKAGIPALGPRYRASGSKPFCGLLPSDLTYIFMVLGASGYKPERRGDRFLMGSLEFLLALSFRPHSGLGVGSASNRTRSRNISSGVKAAGVE
jgi:hypothetical protein